MAGGPYSPQSVTFVTSNLVGPGVHAGAGSGGVKYTRGIQVTAAATLGTSVAYVELIWKAPPVLPSGTGKLHLDMRSQGTGNAKIAVDWVSVAVGEDPSSATLLSEGTSTVTFAGGDSDDFVQLKVTLDADTLVAAEFVCMKLSFVGTSSLWTLNQILTLIPTLNWE